MLQIDYLVICAAKKDFP